MPLGSFARGNQPPDGCPPAGVANGCQEDRSSRGRVAMRLSNRLSWHRLGLLTAMAGLLPLGPLAGQTPGGPPTKARVELNDRNFAEWRKPLLPATGELAWQQIPWATKFKDGIAAADAAGKPLLLWTMNGHPLGCT